MIMRKRLKIRKLQKSRKRFVWELLKQQGENDE